MMGILPDIAADLRISIPRAGYLISAYALGVVVGAPTLVSLCAAWPPKRVLIWFMLLFTVFNALSACSPGFALLLFCRFISGLPHGAFFGVGAIVAARLADEGKAAAAMATMFSGLTLANVAGVPVGTWVGHHLSWRFAFLIVAAVGLLTVASLRKWVPDMAPRPGAGLRADLVIFRRAGLWLALGITAIGTGGFFAWFSYIAPLLTRLTRFAPDALPWIMALVGVGMTCGVHLGGRLADRAGPARSVAVLLVTMLLLLCLNGLCATSQPAMLALAFATGANALALGPPIQMLLIQQAKGAEMLGSSLGQSGFNIGNALGAFLGGIPLAAGYSYAAPQWVAAAMAGVGCLLTALMLSRQRALRSLR